MYFIWESRALTIKKINTSDSKKNVPVYCRFSETQSLEREDHVRGSQETEDSNENNMRDFSKIVVLQRRN